MAAVLVSSSIKILGHVGDAAEHMLKQGEWHQEQFAENTILSTGMTQNYMGSLRAFLPGELRQFLNEHGMKILRCGGLGSLANFCGSETRPFGYEYECSLFQFVLLQDNPYSGKISLVASSAAPKDVVVREFACEPHFLSSFCLSTF